MERKAAGLVTHRKSKVEPVVLDDDAAIASHLNELSQESKKKSVNIEKVFRLFSLTHAARWRKMLSVSAAVRVSDAVREYPILMKALFVSYVFFSVL